MKRVRLWCVGALLCLVFVACPQDAQPPYPELGQKRSCEAFGHLCGLPMTDLGGSDDPAAFRVVFVGDGYLDYQLPDYEQRVFRWVEELRTNPRAYVSRHPNFFHFYLVSLPSRSVEVDNSDLLDTPLAAHLDPDDCESCKKIKADRPSMHLAAERALLKSGESLGRVDSVVLLSNDSEGRANADLGGDVRISSRDDARTLAHELGHALFWLGDEYTEFSSCPSRGTAMRSGPRVDASEASLLATANVSRSDEGAKWMGLVEGSEPGGARWPCWFHPQSHCVMLGNDDALCPVCEAAAREVMRARTCQPDTLPPRVAIEQRPSPLGANLRLLAHTYDERELDDTTYFELDGERVDEIKAARARGAVLDLWTSALPVGAHEVVACRRDRAGHLGCSSPHRFEVNQSLGVYLMNVQVDAQGWLDVEARTVGGAQEVSLRVNGGDPHRAHVRAVTGQAFFRLPLVEPDSDLLHVEAWALRREGELRSAFSFPKDIELPVLAPVPAPEVIAAQPYRVASPSLDGDPDVASHGLEVWIESCAPVREPLLRVGDLAWAPLRAIHKGCVLSLFWIFDLDKNKNADMAIELLDASGKTITSPLPPDLDWPALCPLDVKEIRRPESGVYGLADVIELSGRSVESWSLRWQSGRPNHVGASQATRGHLLVLPLELLEDMSFPPSGRGSMAIDLELSAQVRCPNGRGSRIHQTRTVEVDFWSPEIEVVPQTKQRGWLNVWVRDEGGLVEAQALWPNGSIDLLQAGENRVPARDAHVYLRAIDRAGNVTQRSFKILLDPEQRLYGRCQEVEPW